MPKTAGNAIQNVLAQYSEDELSLSRPKHDGIERFGVKSKFGTRKHTRLYEYKKTLGKGIYEQLFKFTIVRNPWDRVVSKYFFNRMKNDFVQGLNASEIEEKPFDREHFIKIIQCTHSLESFLLERPPSRGKLDFLVDTDINAFIRFENLQEGFDAVCSNIGVPNETLPVRNQSKHRHYSTYYDAETRDMVYEKFKNEIEYFNYEY